MLKDSNESLRLTPNDSPVSSDSFYIRNSLSDFTLLLFTFFNRTRLFLKYLHRVSLMDDFPPPPSSPRPHCSSLPHSLPLRRSALEEINRGWSRYKSSAPRFPIHSPPHSSPPLSTAHYLCRPSAFPLFLLISLASSPAQTAEKLRPDAVRGGNGPFISPQNSGNPPRSHLRLCSAPLRPQFISESCAAPTKRPSRGGLGLRFKESVRWRRGKRSRASRRNERSRRVLPKDRLFPRRRTPAECKKTQ